MKRSAFAGPYVAWMVLFTVAPLLFVVYFAFQGDGGFTLQNIQKFLDPVYLGVLWRSLYLAIYCTLFCLVIGYPAAYFLASKDFEKNQALFVLILLPMWMNFLLRTYAMMTLLEKNGVVNTLLLKLGLPPQNLIGTEAAVLLGMVYNFLPFMILPIYTVMKKIDRRVIEAAEDLGAPPMKVFSRVVVPLSVPGIVSGITMVFMPAVTTFAISRMLGSGMIYLIGDTIEDYFINFNNRNVGSALSLTLMVLIVASIGLLRKADPRGEGGALW